MFLEFEQLHETSRIWIYQAQRELSEPELESLSVFLKNAVESWESHGKPVTGSFKFFHNRILVIAAANGFDEVSGCSIDTSTRWLKQILSETGIDFFDRSVPYFSGEEINYLPVFQIKTFIDLKTISADTYILNHQIDTISRLKKDWKVKASDSPFSRYFVSVSV